MLVARYASGKVGFAEVMAPKVRWRCFIPSLEGDSRAPTSLRSPTSNAPQSATGILCNPFTHVLAQASLDSSVCKSIAERGGFEPPKPFWSLHAFQACLFNHSSISPSSECACRMNDA